MTDRQRPGHGSKPGFEDQATQTAFGKPGQVPGEPGGPNADAFDRDETTERLRPTNPDPAPIPAGDDPLDPDGGGD
jgi:hypothetical protein